MGGAMLADLAGLSALPQPVPIRQLRVRAGTCPGKATGPGGSEDSAATPLLAHPRWGVKAQGGAHPRSHLRALHPLFSSLPPSSKPGTHGGPRVTHGTRDQTAVCPALCDRGAWLLSVLPSCWGAGASRGGCGHLSGLTLVPKGWHSSGSSDPDGKKMLRGLASLQTLSAHVDKPPSSAGGQKHQAVVTGSDVMLGEQGRWDWGHCMGGQPGRGRGRPGEGCRGQLLTGRGWAQGRGPGGAGLLRASGAGTCWLRALTPRPPATPSSSARHFLTLGAGTREPARLGLVLLSQEGG